MPNITTLVLLASLQFQHPIPSLLLNTTSTLQTSIALTLAVPNNTIQISTMYYSIYRNMYYPLTPSSSIINQYPPNITINVQYNIIDPPQTILNMGLIEFNTLMAKSPYVINYSRLIGASDYVLAAGPAELLHLPTSKPRPPSNQQQSSATTQTVLSICKYLILYILMTAVHIEVID